MEKISIIGGGIAGLALANFLEKLKLDYTIYESSATLAPVGAGLALSANALQILDTLGLREQLERAGNTMKGLMITNEHLEKISETNVERLEKKYKVGNLAIHRAALQRVLAENIPSDKIIFNKRLSGISKNNRFTIYFEDETSLETDIVCGADGIRSQVRNLYFEKSALRSAEQICWRAVLETDLAHLYPNTAIEMWGKGKRFGFVRLTENQLYWYALINKKAYRENIDLLQVFKNFDPIVLKMISESDKNKWIKTEIFDLKRLPKWSLENICLIGDAAHATTPNMGQGGCQAIEDAYIIAQLLQQNNNFNSTFVQFENIRRAKVDFVVNQSWKIGKIAQWNHGTALRNALFRLLPSTINEKILDRVLQLEMEAQF